MNYDSLTLWNMVLSFLVACICVWAVLTTKLKTTSLEVLALGAIFLGAMLNIETPLHFGSKTEPGEVLTNIGIVCYGLFVCLRLSFSASWDKLYRWRHLDELKAKRKARQSLENSHEPTKPADNQGF